MPRGAAPYLLLPSEARFASIEVERDQLETLEPLLGGEEPAGGERWVEKRLREFRAGRQVARRVLSELGHPNHVLERGEDGVPSFPDGLAASITHTGSRRTFAAAAALRGARGLGIDAEERRKLGAELCARILGAEEMARLERHGSLDELGLLGFSAKEAFYKCVFPTTRQFLEFRDVEFELTELDDRASEDSLSGSFVIASERCRSQGGPERLSGRFILSAERVITAVVWE